MENGNLSASDIALLSNRNDGFGWGDSSFLWIFALLILAGGGFGNFGFGNNGLANAIGYENLATSNEVQRGFDNQNSLANEREILNAVTAGTAQSIAATNQTFHDTVGVLSDKYSELARDIANLSLVTQQGIANENECCGSTKMLIAETTAGINANMAAQTQKVLDAIAQNKIEALQSQINALQLQAATNNVVRYPNAWTYNAGVSPFCGCSGCGM